MQSGTVRSLSPALLAAMLVAGCGGMDSVRKVWPFDGDSSGGGQVHGPANATQYLCDGSKNFYLRMLDNGATAWVIYPNREVGLNRTGNTGTRYTNGVATLDLAAPAAKLTDGPEINFTGCKPATTK